MRFRSQRKRLGWFLVARYFSFQLLLLLQPKVWMFVTIRVNVQFHEVHMSWFDS